MVRKFSGGTMPQTKTLTAKEKWEQATLANNFIFYNKYRW